MKNYLSTKSLTEPCLRNLFLAPILGAIFLVFLPFIGYGLLMYFLAIKTAEKLSPIFCSPPMAVGSSYLTGSPEGAKVAGVDELDEVAREIGNAKSLDKYGSLN